jgi:hypothetical protein
MPASNTVWICTLGGGQARGAWSRYVFPWNIQYFAQLGNSLYMRHGDIVSYAQESALDDNGADFLGVIQWPWMDFGSPGINKHFIGFDIVAFGTSAIEIGYDQKDLNAWTLSYQIPADTLPDQIIPIECHAPSFAVRLTFDGSQAWQWNALQVYLDDMRPTS